MVTATKTNGATRRRRRERQRSLIEEQETLSRVVRGETVEGNVRTEAEVTPASRVVSPRRRPCLPEQSCDSEKVPTRTVFRQRNNGAWSEGPVQIKSMCMLNTGADETTTSTTATTNVPFVRNSGLRSEGDNISLTSNASSVSTSSTMTADSGTATTDSGASVSTVDGLGDVFKRQSASSLSDLEHLGKWRVEWKGDPVRIPGKFLFLFRICMFFNRVQNQSHVFCL